MRKLLLPVLMLLSVAVVAQKKASEKKIRKYGASIKVKELREKLSIIAGPEMEGRETATPGQRRAAQYIEAKFRELGLKPGNGNSYQMLYPLYKDSLAAVTFTVNGMNFYMDQDFSLSAQTMPGGNWNIDSVVFAGNGIVNKTVDDYKDLDVKDKWVIIDAGNPFAARAKIAAAQQKGAKGVLLVSKLFPLKTPTDPKGRMRLEPNAAANSEYPAFMVSYKVASAFYERSITDSASLSKVTKSTQSSNAKLNVTKTRLQLESSNVLGVLEGTDKKDEYVFLTAHYDHLGKRGDVIYYGADDDGSGTTAVIELAEAFAQAKKKKHGPRRSIVFMAVSGEEKGLLGSEYYSEHPIFPLEKTTVDLNIDMIGRIDPKYKGDSMNYVFVIGDDKLSSDLAPITDSINKLYLNMELDRRYNDVTDPNRYYYRSDHYNFAEKGVPIIFYFNGTHADYHRSTDTIDKINFDLMEKRARLVFYTAWEMANRDAMLKRDIPLNIPPRNQ